MKKWQSGPKQAGMLLATIFPLFVCSAWAGTSTPSDTSVETEVARLVRQALEAEVRGEPQQRKALIDEALAREPDDAPAGWHAGYVRIDGQWLTPKQASQRAQRDAWQIQYRARRNSLPGTVGDHCRLARWCGKHGLDAEARAHWLQVLQFQPNNTEALKRLGLQWYQGMLVTHEAANQYKQQRKNAQRAMLHWRPIVTSWRHDFESGDPSKRQAALEQLRGVTDPAAISALERVLSIKRSSKETPDLSLELVAWLGAMPNQAATRSLVRHAVLSAWPEVRTAAADQLKQRPLRSYIAPLLAGMRSPIESQFQIELFDGTVSLLQRLYCEGPLADDLIADTNYHRTRIVPGSGKNAVPRQSLRAQATRSIRGGIWSAAERIAKVQAKVGTENARRLELNNRIHFVLTRTTGVDLPVEPRSWWQWWADYNELEYPKNRPTRYYYSAALSTNCISATTSCFARGTVVWTLFGLVAVESIRIGDQVLAQDAESGQLAYKPVLATTVRPPSPMLRLMVGDDEMVATLGHPFWVVGEGWRMAKNLKPGDRLHGVGGATAIAGIEQAATDEAFNLVVADFRDYFAGTAQLLVHDNTPRQSTATLVPGLQAP